MCLVVFAWRQHPRYRLLLAANRDEFHDRPATPLGWWPDRPAIAGGRDEQAGGSWLAVSREGRFASVTNYRESLMKQPGERSRGTLVTDFLESRADPLEHAQGLDGARYAGFSLLTATPSAIACVSNRGDAAQTLPPGIYGLSNASLDTPWHKVKISKQRLRDLLDADRPSTGALLDLLADRDPADGEAFMEGGLSREQARAVSAPFVVTARYGTRCSTVLRLGESGVVDIVERRFDRNGQTTGESALSFDIPMSR